MKMKIIDTHVHLYSKPVEKEFNLSQGLVRRLVDKLSQKLRDKKIDQALLYLQDKSSLPLLANIPDNIIVSCIAGVDKRYKEDLEAVFAKKIRLVKIQPYEQKITKDKYPNIVEMAKLIKKKGMALSICSTYGSKSLYETNGVELAAYIKKRVNIPIILIHGGGPKIFEAMTLALEYKDIFLELSFSLKYWWGSSVIKDYAFAIKKLGCKKCFYGSDYPYVDFDESLKYFLKFINTYDFSEKERHYMLYANFDKFRRNYL